MEDSSSTTILKVSPVQPTIRWSSEYRESSLAIGLDTGEDRGTGTGSALREWSRSAVRRKQSVTSRSSSDSRPRTHSNERETHQYRERERARAVGRGSGDEPRPALPAARARQENPAPPKFTPAGYLGDGAAAPSPSSTAMVVASRDDSSSALARLRSRNRQKAGLPSITMQESKTDLDWQSTDRTVAYSRDHYRTEGPDGVEWRVEEHYKAKEQRVRRQRETSDTSSRGRYQRDTREYTSQRTWLVQDDNKPQLIDRRQSLSIEDGRGIRY